MKKLLITAAMLIFVSQAFSQQQKTIPIYLSVQYNKTIYDRTWYNNPWSFGAGVQAFYNNRTKFKPTIELTADVALESYKIYYMSADGKGVPSASGFINLLVGSSFHPIKQFYISFLVGPSFINGNTYFGIKPSIGFYFSKKQKLGLRISYINVFNREPNYEETKKEDFGSIGFNINVKLF